MMIVAFVCFIALIAAWFVAPKEMHTVEVPVVAAPEVAVSVAS